MSDFHAYVFCDGGFDANGGSVSCGRVGLTSEQFEEQLKIRGVHWKCPTCGAKASFDDEGFAKSQQVREQKKLYNFQQILRTGERLTKAEKKRARKAAQRIKLSRRGS